MVTKHRVVGFLFDEGHDRWEIGRLRVSLRMGSPGGLHGSREIGGAFVDGGVYQFDYPSYTSAEGKWTLELVVADPVGRVLDRRPIKDTFDDVLHPPDITISRAEGEGYPVTLGTGMTTAMSTGNTVTPLIDQEAFVYAAGLLKDAKESVQLSQLFFAVPDVFDADASSETPTLVFDFHDPAPDTEHLRATGVGDARPERLLLDAADKGADVKVLLHAFTVPLIIKIIAGVLVFPFAGTDGVFEVTQGLLGSDLTDTDEVRRYFASAARPNIKVQDFPQPFFSAGVMHAKLMVVDGRNALSFGSPFGQSYIDTHDHRIDAPVRGDTDGFPKHDAGFAVTGPALLDIYRAIKLLWDTAAPDDHLPDLPFVPPVAPHAPDPPAALPHGETAVCSVQIVKTLTAGRFGNPPDDDDGEKGILEGYLRAFAAARDFIYLENQYFTNDAIADALVAAMNNNPGAAATANKPTAPPLQVIMLLNIRPDMPLYPRSQRRLLHRMKDALNHPEQLGVFTRWTHEVGPRPRLLPVYVHAKAGIVDNGWATVGSANLDGLSLDSFYVSDLLHRRAQRAVEVNALMYAGVADQAPSAVVDILRRKLWAEHLGYAVGPDVPDPAAADLATRPSAGWLSLWSSRAAETLQHLIDTPALPLTGKGRVLPWPSDNTTHKTPRDHLEALGIHPYAVVPLKSTRAFEFKTGDWKPGSSAAMDYD